MRLRAKDTASSEVKHHSAPTPAVSSPVITITPPVVLQNESEHAAWPNLQFTGLSKISGQRGLAIINNQIVREGDVIEGVSIVSVTKTGLLAQCGSNTKFLPFYIASESNPRSSGTRQLPNLGQVLRKAFGK